MCNSHRRFITSQHRFTCNNRSITDHRRFITAHHAGITGRPVVITVRRMGMGVGNCAKCFSYLRGVDRGGSWLAATDQRRH